MKKIIMMLASLVGSAVLLQAALTTGTTYTGGDMTLATGWDNNLPNKEGGSPGAGLIDGSWGASVETVGDFITGQDIRHSGGDLSGASLYLHGDTIYELDADGNYADVDLDISGELIMWTPTVGPELRILSGRVEADSLNFATGLIQMGDGVLRIGSCVTSGSFNMLAGGSGHITINVVNTNTFDLNFESGSEASFTIGSKDVGGGPVTAAGFWEWVLANTDKITIDGVVTHDVSAFTITQYGLSSTISLPYAPWWDDFPRMVDANDVATVDNYHGNFAMNGHGHDPSWGTFFQAHDISTKTTQIAAFQNAGMKQIGYFETYGQSYSLVAELGAWDETNLTPVLRTHWSWQNYSGGTIRWLGANNFFDDEEFARPYTRTHSRYGGPAMTYPDGTEATGYDGPETDPRNSRVYDAACSKDLLGNIYIDSKYAPPAGSPTDGLVYVPEVDEYIGLFMFKKDAACPLWTDYTYASTLQAADAGIDGMWTDNYGPWDSLSSNPVQAGFGDWSVARFRDYLANSFSGSELLAMGVTDVETFDVRAHLISEATLLGWGGSDLGSALWKDSTWLDDPLWRAYLIFKRQTGTEALSNYYTAVKSAAFAGGKDEFMVGGNDIPGFSFGWCRGDVDMVSTELSLGWSLSGGSQGFTLPPVGRCAPFYKLAREHAKGRFVNVWLYNHAYETELSNPQVCNALYYEMLANHTFPKLDPGNSRYTGDEATNAAFFEFVESAVPSYGDRVPVEKVGLYYSSSSLLRHFTPGGYEAHNAQPHQFSFWGWGTALTELHIQYRAMPEWKLTAEELAGLELLVLPNADVLDPADVTGVLEPWLNSGGRLVIAGDCGIYLGESGNFDLNPAGSSVTSISGHANVTVLTGNLGMDYFLDYENRSAAQRAQFAAAIAGHTAQVSTDASHKAGVSLFTDEAAGRFFVDVNNVDVDPTTYVVTGTGAIEVEAVLPSWLQGKLLAARVVSPGSPTVELLTPSDSNHVKFALTSVDAYAGVIIEEAAAQWVDPAQSGSWNVDTNWVSDVPTAEDDVVWQYASGNPSITVESPVEVNSFLAVRSDPLTSYRNTGGLRIVNVGSSTGQFAVNVGVLDLFDGGWYGARLSVVNEDELAAADVVNAAAIKLRTFQLDTTGTASGFSYYTHEAGTLEVQVQIELGAVSTAGHEAVFRQTGGSVHVNHWDYGLKLGQGLTQGSYMLDGGSSSFSTIDFAHVDSVFEFNNGTFASGAQDVLWKNTGILQLAGTGVHTFDIAAGQTMTLNAEVQLTDKSGEQGTLVKTGDGTLVLETSGSNSGSMDIQAGVLSLSSAALDAQLYLHIQGGALVDLNFAGTNTARALSFDDGSTWAAAGTWGAAGSGAANESSQLSGAGLLQVATDLVAPTAWTQSHFTAVSTSKFTLLTKNLRSLPQIFYAQQMPSG